MGWIYVSIDRRPLPGCSGGVREVREGHGQQILRWGLGGAAACQLPKSVFSKRVFSESVFQSLFSRSVFFKKCILGGAQAAETQMGIVGSAAHEVLKG